MSIFDMGSVQGLQGSGASALANSLAPKRHNSALQAQTNVTAKDSTPGAGGTNKSSSSSDDGGTITSTDFLTLLVSELKNQDPTQPTDPNAYITQLVGVNSLQQLISINKGISTIDDGISGPSTPTTPAP